MLWLATLQSDELATRYLKQGKMRKALHLAERGVDVSERYLELMEEERG
jgi:hypothetical protein